jgi:hypothetical protein
MNVYVTFIRKHWPVIVVFFLDDILLLHQNSSFLAQATLEIIHLLRWLGWIINIEKSSLNPLLIFRYLGWLWDSIHLCVSLPLDKAQALGRDI